MCITIKAQRQRSRTESLCLHVLVVLVGPQAIAMTLSGDVNALVSTCTLTSIFYAGAELGGFYRASDVTFPVPKGLSGRRIGGREAFQAHVAIGLVLDDSIVLRPCLVFGIVFAKSHPLAVG